MKTALWQGIMAVIILLGLVGRIWGAEPGPEYNRFGFPETSSTISVLVDQLPNHLTEEQVRFVAGHYVGSQKLILPLTQRIRRYNPRFVVLHYHLGIWQQQPAHKFIIDGKSWGNDWSFVNRHEDWFWHNEKGQRVRSKNDGKYLMNIMNPEFQEYWKTSIARQIIAGEYQGVFLDSASPALLQCEASWMDPRLAGTAAAKRRFKELGGITWSKAYESFMADLTKFLESLGYATLPNIGGLFTTWDTTDYYTTASGAFMEGAFVTRSLKDWEMAASRTMELIKRDKIVIFQSYLKNDEDIKTRLYYLSCYLLFKGRYTYINYFYRSTLSWYPEWQLDLGLPREPIPDLVKMRVKRGLYRRLYSRGEVWINVSSRDEKITFPRELRVALPIGGGPVGQKGEAQGRLSFRPAQEVVLQPWSGLIVLY